MLAKQEASGKTAWEARWLHLFLYHSPTICIESGHGILVSDALPYLRVLLLGGNTLTIDGAIYLHVSELMTSRRNNELPVMAPVEHHPATQVYQLTRGNS